MSLLREAFAGIGRRYFDGHEVLVATAAEDLKPLDETSAPWPTSTACRTLDPWVVARVRAATVVVGSPGEVSADVALGLRLDPEGAVQAGRGGRRRRR